MKPLLILLSAVTVSLGQNPIPIEPPSPGKTPGKPESAVVFADNPATPRVFEFSNDDISVVLRAIARQAKINVVVHEDIKGRVTLRLENRTPRQAIEVICAAHDLAMNELHGVHYIQPREAPLKAEAEREARRAKILLDAYIAQGFSRAEAIELIARSANGEKQENEKSSAVSVKKKPAN